MSAGFRTTLTRGGLAALLAGLLVATFAQPVRQATAQGLFDSLFGGFGGQRSYSRVRAYAPPSYDERHAAPDFSNREPRSERSSEYGRGGGTYCVRVCDGRYFPLPRATGGAQLNPAKVCSALCPAAQTQVFNGHPEHGAAADGTRYADLANAFAFRDRVVPDCSCTGRGPGGLAQIDVGSDPTLRTGDVVATAGGLTVFKGASQFPYKSADFTPIESYSRVNADLRRKLSEVRVDPTATSVTPVQKVATGPDETRVAKPRPRKPRMQATDSRGSGNWGWDSLFR